MNALLEYLPPRISREITLGGYAVPHLEASETKDGLECHICLDQRFGAVVPAEYAQPVLWLIANALAIGAGYSCHGENSRISNPFKVLVSEVESVTKGRAP